MRIVCVLLLLVATVCSQKGTYSSGPSTKIEHGDLKNGYDTLSANPNVPVPKEVAEKFSASSGASSSPDAVSSIDHWYSMHETPGSDLQNATYHIVVSTSRFKHSGTKNEVFIQLFGADVASDLYSLGSFERGQTKSLKISDYDIGDVLYVNFLVEGSDAWLNRRTVVIKGDNRYTFENIDNKWLRCSKKGCSIQIGSSDVTNLLNVKEEAEEQDAQSQDDQVDLEDKSTPQTPCLKCTYGKDGKTPVPLRSNWEKAIASYTSIKKRVFKAGFTNWLDCNFNGPVRFEYTAYRDCGCYARAASFKKDAEVDASCQQLSTDGYGFGYDRGHLVPANHFDHDPESVVETNTMTNILPQYFSMNRGAWLVTEEIIECTRDVEPVSVVGGAIWAEKPGKTEMLTMPKHGVEVPLAFWKAIRVKDSHKEDNGIIAWWVPNTKDAVRENLDQFIVSIEELENRLALGQIVSTSKPGEVTVVGEVFDLTPDQKKHKPKTSWGLVEGCSLA